MGALVYPKGAQLVEVRTLCRSQWRSSFTLLGAQGHYLDETGLVVPVKGNLNDTAYSAFNRLRKNPMAVKDMFLHTFSHIVYFECVNMVGLVYLPFNF